MKILFIFYEDYRNPKTFPLGVGLLSSILKKEGHKVEGLHIHSNVDDAGELEKILTRVVKADPDLICYSFTSPAFEEIKRIAKYLKKEIDIPTIAGSVHSTLYPEEVLAQKSFDYVCVGEGEKAIVEFVDNLGKGLNCSNIPGIWTFGKEKGLIKNKLFPLTSDLDSLPMIDFDVFGKSFIEQLTEKGWLRYISSRGCPFSCSYCHTKMIRNTYAEKIGIPISKMGYIRFNSVNRMIEEIKDMLRRYNLKVINFMDDVFCLNRERTLEFCHKFRESIDKNVGYSIQTHLEYLDEEIVDALRNSRCLRVVVGVESASQRILNILKRKANFDEMTEKLSLLIKAKFPLGTWTLNILANPTETKREMIETVAFNAKHLVERVKINFLSPYPGSEIHDFCKKYDLLKNDSEKQHFHDRHVTKLKFPYIESAFLEKFFDVGHWYLNVNAPLNVEHLYLPLIEEAEAISPGEWDKAKSYFKKIDRELSDRLVQDGKQHYEFVFQGEAYGNVIGLTQKMHLESL